MAADLQPVGTLAHVIGVMDGPAGEPENLLLQLAENAQRVGVNPVHGLARPLRDIRSIYAITAVYRTLVILSRPGHDHAKMHRTLVWAPPSCQHGPLGPDRKSVV